MALPFNRHKAACPKGNVKFTLTMDVYTCRSVIGPMLWSLQTTSSKCTLIFFLMKRSRCFWFIHDAAWTWVSTCHPNKSHTSVLSCSEYWWDRHIIHHDYGPIQFASYHCAWYPCPHWAYVYFLNCIF